MTIPAVVPMNSPADTIDVADVGRAVRRGWRLVLTFTVLGALGAALVVFFAPPKFSGEASMVVKTGSDPSVSLMSRLGGGGADAAAGGLLGGALKSPIETEIQIMSSRAVLGRVMDSLELQARVRSPRGYAPYRIVSSLQLAPLFAPASYRFTRVGQSGYRVEADGKVIGEVAPGGSIALPVGTLALRPDVALPAFDLRLLDYEDGVDRLSKHISITKAAGEIARISYRGDDSLSAAAVPNALISIYLARRKTTDRGVNQHRVEFLVAKADSASRDLSDAERALRNQQETSGVLDPTVVGKLELERAGQMRGSLTDLQVEDGAIKQLISRVEAGTIQPRELAAYPAFLKSAGINEVLSQLSQVETERLKLLETRTERDPEAIALATSAKNIEGQLLPLARSYSTSLGKQRNDLERALDSLQRKIAYLPGVAESGLRLQREVLRRGQIYATVQAQLVEARLAAIQEGGDVRALDAAMPARKPSFPQPFLTAGLGVGGGLVLGMIVAVLVGMLGRWVEDPHQVEQSTGLPALRLHPAMPLLLGGEASQTVLIVPVDPRARVEPVARQIVETALARSISATILDLSSLGSPAQRALPATGGEVRHSDSRDVNKTIERLEQEHGMVVVQLPGFDAPATLAALRRTRSVVLVVPDGRIDRAQLNGAVQTLRRLDLSCAGIVLSGSDRNGVLSH